MKKELSGNLTSYDIIKTFAVVIMIVDHIGNYFYPDESWWRAVGRLCVPVWFFLIGYAHSRNVGVRMWGGVLILALASLVTGMGLLPLNALATMIVIRLVIDNVMLRAMSNGEALWQMGVFLLLLSFPTAYFFEYGTYAIIMAMFGWLVRHQNEYPLGPLQTQLFFLFAALSFIALQTIYFSFNPAQVATMSAGVLAVMGVLFFFKPFSFSGTGDGLPGIMLWPFRFMGRRTLEIYVAHLVIFKVIAVLTQPERFHWFDWRWLPEAALSLNPSGALPP